MSLQDEFAKWVSEMTLKQMALEEAWIQAQLDSLRVPPTEVVLCRSVEHTASGITTRVWLEPLKRPELTLEELRKERYGR